MGQPVEHEEVTARYIVLHTHHISYSILTCRLDERISSGKVFLSTCMMSAYLYDVRLPVWFLPTCVMSAQLYSMMSAHLNDVSSTVWCLPTCLFFPVCMISAVCHLLNCMMSAQLYDICLSCMMSTLLMSWNFRNEVVLIYTKGNFWDVYWFMSKKLTAH
jgi:hypothetical protein